MTEDDQKTSPLFAAGDKKPTAAVKTVYHETVKSGKASADGRVTTVAKVTKRKSVDADGIEMIDEKIEIDASVDGQVMEQVFGAEGDALDAGEACRNKLQQRHALREPNDDSTTPTNKRIRPKSR